MSDKKKTNKTNKTNEINEIQEESRAKSLPRITYADKIDINPEPSFPSENLFEANDANEIKLVTNQIADSLETFDSRINDAVNKATSAEEQATRLGLTVSGNSTKIVALETKYNQQSTNISGIADRINEHTNVLNGILRIKKMTINFSQIRLIQEIDKGNRTRFQNYNYELPISYSRVVAVVPMINGGTSPEKMICSPKVFTNNWIELSCVHFDTTTRFNIGGHFTILYI